MGQETAQWGQLVSGSPQRCKAGTDFTTRARLIWYLAWNWVAQCLLYLTAGVGGLYNDSFCSIVSCFPSISYSVIWSRPTTKKPQRCVLLIPFQPQLPLTHLKSAANSCLVSKRHSFLLPSCPFMYRFLHQECSLCVWQHTSLVGYGPNIAWSLQPLQRSPAWVHALLLSAALHCVLVCSTLSTLLQLIAFTSASLTFPLALKTPEG